MCNHTVIAQARGSLELIGYPDIIRRIPRKVSNLLYHSDACVIGHGVDFFLLDYCSYSLERLSF